MMIRCVLSGTLVFLLCTNTEPALADEESARDNYMSGLEKIEKNDYNGAVRDFEASAEEYPNYNCIYNLAVCYYKLERHYDSLKAFERLQREFPEKITEEDRQRIGAKMAQLEHLVPKLNIQASPLGAHIVVDGTERGTSPLSSPVIVSAGRHRIEILNIGYEKEVRELTVAPRDNIDIVIELARTKSSLTIAVNEQGALVQIDGVVVGTTPLGQPLPIDLGEHSIRVGKPGFVDVEEPFVLSEQGAHILEISLWPISFDDVVVDTATARRNRAMMITGVVGAGVMAALSAGFWGAAFGKRDDYIEKNDALDPEKGGAWNNEMADERDDAKDAAIRFNKIAVVTTAVTGAFLALTVLGWVLRMTHKEGRDEMEREKEVVVWSSQGVEIRF